MKTIKTSLLGIMASALLLVSCNSYKTVPYLQNSQTFNESVVSSLFDAKIMPKDQITITVNTTDPIASAPFNLTVQTNVSNALAKNVTTQPSLMSYLVANDGTIDFPILGILEVGGKTKSEVEELVREKLKPYLNERPVVNVRMANFKISVLGEVTNPGEFTISKEKVNVFEALALAKDLTIWGVRENVKLIREHSDGTHQIVELNLTDAEIINSPYYQLQQNDIIYVTPNKTKAKNSDIGQSTTLWFSATSILISLVSLLYNILK